MRIAERVLVSISVSDGISDSLRLVMGVIHCVVVGVRLGEIGPKLCSDAVADRLSNSDVFCDIHSVLRLNLQVRKVAYCRLDVYSNEVK